MFFYSSFRIKFAHQKKRGYKISKWASEHKTKAQILLVLSTCIAVTSSFGLGNILQWQTSRSMLLASGSLVAMSMLVNSKKVRKERHLFKDRVSFTMLNAGTIFCSFFAGANIISVLNSDGNPEDPTILPSAFVPILNIVLTGLPF